MTIKQKKRSSRPTTTPDAPDVNLQYRPQGDTLREFHRLRDEVNVRVLIGPLGSAKTTSCIMEVLDHIHNQNPDANGVRRTRVAIVRNTFPDLNSTTIPDFREVVERMNVGKLTMGSPPMWECHYDRADGTKVHGQVIFRSFDTASDDKKARGMQLSGVWMNEAKELNKANVDMLQGRVGRYPPRAELPNNRTMIIMDCNAPDRDEWMGQLVKVEKPKGWWFGIQPPGVLKVGGEWVPNPRAENFQNLPPGYYAKQIAGKSETWVRKNLANEFIFHTDNRPVHPDFSESVHVMPCKPTPGLPLVVGIDFGRTPAAAILQKQTDGQWYCLKELVCKNMGADRFGELLFTFMNDHFDNYEVEFIGDPAGDSMAQTRDETPFMLLEDGGISAWPAPTNDPLIRYAALDDLLRTMVKGQPAIIFDPSCSVLVRGLAGAYYFRRMQVVGDNRFKDSAEKTEESHVCEALHYGLLGGGQGTAQFDQDGMEEYDSPDSDSPWAAESGSPWMLPAAYGE